MRYLLIYVMSVALVHNCIWVAECIGGSDLNIRVEIKVTAPLHKQHVKLNKDPLATLILARSYHEEIKLVLSWRSDCYFKQSQMQILRRRARNWTQAVSKCSN